jgi:hypothetical protein
VTTDAARLLGLRDVGHLAPGTHADWIAVKDVAPSSPNPFSLRERGNKIALEAPLPEGEGLGVRATLALIVRGGVPQIGDVELMARFPQVQTVPALLDGVPKCIERRLAARIRACGLREAGIEIG